MPWTGRTMLCIIDYIILCHIILHVTYCPIAFIIIICYFVFYLFCFKIAFCFYNLPSVTFYYFKFEIPGLCDFWIIFFWNSWTLQFFEKIIIFWIFWTLRFFHFFEIPGLCRFSIFFEILGLCDFSGSFPKFLDFAVFHENNIFFEIPGLCHFSDFLHLCEKIKIPEISWTLRFFRF